jgi:hypothetical protein
MRRRQGSDMKKFWFGLIACGGAGIASGAEEVVKLLPSPLEMPRRIGPLVNSEAPHKYEDPRLGISYQYNGEGLSLTVYIYDAGIGDIPDGADNIPVCEQFEEAKAGIVQSYQNTTLKTEQLARLDPPADTPLAREAVYEFEREKHPTVSFVWITAVAKNFVKLRFSVDPRLRDEIPEARRAVLSALGTAVKPYLVAVDAKAQKPGTSINIYGANASNEEMAAGFIYLALLSTLAEKTPEQAPVCGGEIAPSFDTELAAYRGASEFADSTSTTALGRRIAQIDKAGFLEEFVWTDLHRETWGDTPPEGLTLGEFKKWRKKNLKRFRVPNFGSVVVNHPRALAIEPPETP